jgi:hypothetical protein
MEFFVIHFNNALFFLSIILITYCDLFNEYLIKHNDILECIHELLQLENIKKTKFHKTLILIQHS